MKKIILLSAVTLLLSSSNLVGQMIVKVKPQKPKIVIVKPSKIYKNKVWMDGHWKWSNQSSSYQWVKGHWTKRRRNNTWKAGKWQKLPAGWKYVSGRWATS